MSLGEEIESGARVLYEHVPHPWRDQRKQAGPVKVADQHARGSGVTRFNASFAVLITRAVGSMWCAYAFALFDLISLPDAIRAGTAAIVSWIAQTFLQLVLLSVIMVGQDVQAKAADKRAESTYKDAEAVLQGQEQQALHLAKQDEAITSIQQHLLDQDAAVAGILTQVEQVLARLAPTATQSAEGAGAP